MSKQVQDAVQHSDATAHQSKNLYVTVTTYDAKGKQVGVRVVDMYHYGTRNWVQNHLWWAVHQKPAHVIEINEATEVEVDEYLATQAKALQEKFAKEPVAA